ncbi:MAG: transglutaminase domain-containing protein [Oscillospiraceae bacterium]|jgi:hypothetical protein
MKRTVRFSSIFIFALIAISLLGTAFATDNRIDVSTASEGYFTVHYSDGSDIRMKVGVEYGEKEIYYNYTAGEDIAYPFANGSGDYSIAVYQNVSGTSYKAVLSERVSVNIEEKYSQYLVSTSEITFSDTDAVGKKAAELAGGKSTDTEKVVAFYNYIVSNFSYDYEFARKVKSGLITHYTPNTNRILEAKKGVCYDFSALFAAMCRSQGIPSVITKGYYSGVRHAWNKVYVNGGWYAIDLTYAISNNAPTVVSMSACLTPVTSYTGSSDNLPLADTLPDFNINQYVDLDESAWYSEYIARACILGYMSGKTTSTFAPNTGMKLSDVIKLAGSLRSDYYGGGFTKTDDNWIQYAVDNGIIGRSEYSNYNSFATKAEFVQILANALPDEALPVINPVADGALAGVEMSAVYAPAVYKLYRAGIISESDLEGFNPDSKMTRAEIAAIAVRMADESYRVTEAAVSPAIAA